MEFPIEALTLPHEVDDGDDVDDVDENDKLDVVCEFEDVDDLEDVTEKCPQPIMFGCICYVVIRTVLGDLLWQ